MNSDMSVASSVRPPFSARQDVGASEEHDVSRERIPDHLFTSLLDWAIKRYSCPPPRVGVPNPQMLLKLERYTRRLVPTSAFHDMKGLGRAFWPDHVLFLDAIDLALSQSDEAPAGGSPEVLEAILREAGSIYCVGLDGNGNFQLQSRQSAALVALVESEANQPDRAAQHLRSAWSKCFGRHPDTKGACREAVEAIEVAAKPAVTPNDPVTTLGKMCSAIRAKPEKWETDSEFAGSVETVLAMMDMVWKGHYRHGDETAPLEVSQEAAEMTVQTAVLLVGWFHSGRIRFKQ